MVKCWVNREPKIVDSALKTWGELLDGLDEECAARRRTVTAVRIDGVDQPSFREASLVARPLAPIARIDVETVDRTRLLRGTLGSATQSLPALASAACRAASAFRDDDLTLAHQQLTALVEAIRTLTLLTVASATAAGTDLDHLTCGGVTGADVLGGVGVVLDVLAQSQQARDWAAVADGLDHELAPALLEWGVVFDAMHERCAA